MHHALSRSIGTAVVLGGVTSALGCFSLFVEFDDSRIPQPVTTDSTLALDGAQPETLVDGVADSMRETSDTNAMDSAIDSESDTADSNADRSLDAFDAEDADATDAD